MKRRVTIGIVILMVMCVALVTVPFRAMLVCVHDGGGHGEKAIHLHYGQLPGYPCHESSPGLNHTAGAEGRRHFSLVFETLTHAQTSFKRVLSLLPPAQFHHLDAIINPPVGPQGGYGFYDPSFVFTDTPFTNTTILII
jgi:hypothetical protein